MAYPTQIQTQLKSASDAPTQATATLRRWSQFPLQISQRKLLLIGMDVTLLNLALLLGLRLDFDMPLSYATLVSHLIGLATLTLLWLAIASAGDTYEVKRAAQMSTSTFGVLRVLLITGILYTLPTLLLPSLPMTLFTSPQTWVVAAALLALWRITYATVLVQPNFHRRVLVVGAGRAARSIAWAIEEHDPGYQIIGYVSGDAAEQDQEIRGISVSGKGTNLAAFVQNNGVSDIVLAMSRPMPPTLKQAVLNCFEQGIRIVPMPQLFEEITGRIPVEYIGEGWLISLPTDRNTRGLYSVVKRGMDIVIASIGLLICAPLFALLAVVIKLDSPGPVFYRPERLGQGGRPFRLWKFRTMVSNADRIGNPTFTQKNDSRITRVGRILRLCHIDEFPQFINVLRGNMSIVGPRPERYVPALEESIPFYRTRYAVKPGATGLALIKQGYAEGIEGTLIKLHYDLYYIKHQSLRLDILILLKSVIHMLTMRGR